MLGLGCSFSHVGWLLRTQPHSLVGKSIQEHQESTGLIPVVLVVLVLMWVPCSLLAYVVDMGCLPATPVAFVASTLCTILPSSPCAISPTLCFTSPTPARQGSGTSSTRSMAARNLRGV